MPVISVCSPKGGVGKTTVVANLAYAFSRSGSKVVVVDFDPQNALRLYFGLSLNDERGFVTLPHNDWLNSCINVDKNLFMLPFGKSNKEQRTVLDEALKEPDYFRKVQGSIFNNPDVLVIADFPPGYSQALESIASVSKMQIVPLLADAASVSLFSQLLAGGLMDGLVGGGLGYYIVLNQIDNRIKLNREVQNFAIQNFKDNLLGMIHRDISVTEAAGQQVSVYARNTVHLPVPVTIKKMDMTNNETLLANAVFSLYGSDAVDDEGNLKDDAQAIRTGITTQEGDDLGFADLNELENGIFYLVEDTPPAGYVLPDYEYIKITVTSEGVGYQAGKIGEPKTAEKITRDEKEVYCIEVLNTAGVELPSAGGPGTTWIYLLGVILFIGCSTLLIARRRAL